MHIFHILYKIKKKTQNLQYSTVLDSWSGIKHPWHSFIKRLISDDLGWA